MKKFLIIAAIIILSGGLFFIKPSESSNEVVFWTLQMGTFDKYMNGVIAEFEAKNPDVKIKWIDVPYSEGEKRTLASILSNTPPDLVNLTPDFSSVLAQKQALEFLDCEKLSAFNSEIVNDLKYQGKCYAIPFYATSSLTFYNKELFKKSGLQKLPVTYDDLNRDAAAIKAKNNVFATMPTVAENDTMLKILNKYDINTPETLASEKSQKIFSDYKMLYQKDLIPKESITQTHREALEKYMSGQLVFIQSGANFLNIVKENAPQVYKHTDVSNQLVGDTGKYDVSIMNLVIPVKARHKDGALRFALFLTNKQNQLELAKLTTILPVNKDALSDTYFTKADENDVISKARKISASQLNNLESQVQFERNRKEFLTILNTTVQQILLGERDLKTTLEKTAESWKILEQK